MSHIEVHEIYVEIFIPGIREPLANTGQLCITISHLRDILYCMTAIRLIDWWAFTFLERSFVILCDRVSCVLNFCSY